MSKYDELVKALRYCSHGGLVKCNECQYGGKEWPVGCMEAMMRDAAAAIEELQAEVKRLKECIDELREAQTYIDRYGDKWMTSAKDVPTSAYNHGYMDGKNEAEQVLEPKRGKWTWIQRANGGHYKGCSVCHAPMPTDSMLDYLDDEDCEFCYSCGAKMEVQE